MHPTYALQWQSWALHSSSHSVRHVIGLPVGFSPTVPCGFAALQCTVTV